MHKDIPMMRSVTKFVMLLCLLVIGQSTLAQTSGTVTYVYTDPQGTPLAEADARGNITATFDYTPYGTYAPNGTSNPGPDPNGPGYTGHVNDPETNLVYMQARYYDPATAQFLSVDPIKAVETDTSTFNRYSYGRNNPVFNVDPDGKQANSPLCNGSSLCNEALSCSVCVDTNNTSTPSTGSIKTLETVVVRAALDEVVPAKMVAPDPVLAAKYSDQILDVQAAAITASAQVPLWVPQPIRGMMVHYKAQNILQEQNPMYRREVSYLKGFPASYGTPFSSRFDVVYQDPQTLRVIGFDIKTGAAYITQGQLNRYVSNAPAGALIIQVKVP